MIKKLLNLLNNECKRINLKKPMLIQIPAYNDMPKIPHFTVYMDKSIFNLTLQPHALHSNHQTAKLKAIMEAFERLYYKFPNISCVKRNNITYSDEGGGNQSFIQVFDIYKNQHLIAADLFMSKKLNDPYRTTIGTSAHFSLDKALTHAILELIAADAFKNFYFKNTEFSLINIKSINKKNSPKIYSLLHLLNNYQFTIHFLLLTSKIPHVFSILSILRDKTNYFQGITVGIKASLDLNEAIIESIYEALVVYKGLRTIIENEPLIPKKDKPYNLITWLTDPLIAKKFLKRINKKIHLFNFSHTDNSNINLIKLIKSKKIPIYWNIISPKTNKLIFVVRVVSPYFDRLILNHKGNNHGSLKFHPLS